MEKIAVQPNHEKPCETKAEGVVLPEVRNEETDSRRQELGQFFTPQPVADFMASLFQSKRREFNLLDAGAGTGALSAALVRKLCSGSERPQRITITAYEIDETLIPILRQTLCKCERQCLQAGVQFSATVFNEDFIQSAVPLVRDELFVTTSTRFNAAIVNPPYRKIRSDSAARSALRSAGIETSNLYTGFLALIVKLMGVGGEMVAVTPRSFCNGPYFKPFRTEFLRNMTLQRLHVFESRSAAFRGDDVLQENIIFHAVKGTGRPEQVVISTSSGETDASIFQRNVNYEDVVSSSDPDQFIHLVSDDTQALARKAMARFSTELVKLGLSVSTGRVVDFRVSSLLRKEPETGSVPLIYPCHFNGGFVHWPRTDSRKHNAIVRDSHTENLLVPQGIYVLVKRFSSKEERRRVVACLYDPSRIETSHVGFENHLNYFHANGTGLPLNIAKGLTAFLNSTMVDVYFRQFNGHTQVNATDLRSFGYPTREQLDRLGARIERLDVEQQILDDLVQKELNCAT